jgi:hypothetical protein
MDNGVKLFEEGNYEGAIAEFEAAYRAEARPAPLINLALSHKKRNRYAKARDVLQRALHEHAGSMKPEQRQAAEIEVKELDALIAWVTVRVTPASARLFVDDEAMDTGLPIALSPGPHRLRAELGGHQAAEATIRVVSGRDNAPVDLVLPPLDPVAPPGPPAQQPPPAQPPADKPAAPAEAPRRGIYVVGSGALLLALPFKSEDEGVGFESAAGRLGGAIGAQAGYRVADWAGFELMLQLSSIKLEATDRAAGTAPTSGELRDLRAGVLFRALYPPATRVCFLATVGGGFLFEQLRWDTTNQNLLQKADGLNGFFQIDLGIEIEVSRVLIDVVVQSTVQPTSHLDVQVAGGASANAFENEAILLLGPQGRVGYAFW